jgi:hypothetical protein
MHMDVLVGMQHNHAGHWNKTHTCKSCRCRNEILPRTACGVPYLSQHLSRFRKRWSNRTSRLMIDLQRSTQTINRPSHEMWKITGNINLIRIKLLMDGTTWVRRLTQVLQTKKVANKMPDVCRIHFGSEHLIYVSLKSTQYRVTKFKTLF